MSEHTIKSLTGLFEKIKARLGITPDMDDIDDGDMILFALEDLIEHYNGLAAGLDNAMAALKAVKNFYPHFGDSQAPVLLSECRIEY